MNKFWKLDFFFLWAKKTEEIRRTIVFFSLFACQEIGGKNHFILIKRLALLFPFVLLISLIPFCIPKKRERERESFLFCVRGVKNNSEPPPPPPNTSSHVVVVAQQVSIHHIQILENLESTLSVFVVFFSTTFNLL